VASVAELPVLVLALVAARRWTALMALTMVPRRTTGVCTAGVRWAAMATWLRVMTTTASASGST